MKAESLSLLVPITHSGRSLYGAQVGFGSKTKMSKEPRGNTEAQGALSQWLIIQIYIRLISGNQILHLSIKLKRIIILSG